jgi:hypothetical protein
MINEMVTVPNNNKHYNRMGDKITILETSMKTQNFSSIKLPTQGIMYPQWTIIELGGYSL